MQSLFPKTGIFLKTEKGILYHGDVIEVLKVLPNSSIDCVVTSPPYWGVRFYSNLANRIWGGDPQCQHDWDFKNKGDSFSLTENMSKFVYLDDRETKLDQKSQSEEYITGFCKKCGAWYGQLGLEPDFYLYLEHLWMIFDEVYRVLKPTGTLWVVLSDTYFGSGRGGQGKNTACNVKGNLFVKMNYYKKSLSLVPERFAIGMVKRKWLLRNVIIWEKLNALPESVKDRFTRSFEYIYFFTKQKSYYFNQQLEKTKAKVIEPRMLKEYRENYSNNKYDYIRPKRTMTRNMRNVWSINTVPSKTGHPAPFPPKVPETCIRAGCPEGGIVLDPFMGSGTTALVAEKLGYNWVGIELNKEYCEITKRRLLSIKTSLKLF